MQRRRERIEKWRKEKKLKETETPLVILPPSKVWSLEDEAEEDEDVAKNGGAEDGEDDEIDPLDAFMMVRWCACPNAYIAVMTGLLCYHLVA